MATKFVAPARARAQPTPMVPPRVAMLVLAVVVHGHQARNEGHRPLLIQRRPQKLDFQDYAAQIEKTFEELEQVCLDSELTRDIQRYVQPSNPRSPQAVDNGVR